MDYTSLITGALVGAGLVSGITLYLKRVLANAQSELIEMQGAAIKGLVRKLTNLRRNAYLTNELGHRVRYSKASAEVRARAEAE